jgi:hypothetical protein
MIMHIYNSINAIKEFDNEFPEVEPH